MIRRLPGARLVNEKIEVVRGNTQQRINSARQQAFRGGLIILVSGTVVWLSVFLYVAFYYTYIPQLTHTRPVHLQFSFPTAHIQLTKRHQILMVGQKYKIFLHFDMPESEANQNLGMFMVCLQLNDKDGYAVANSCRPVMLHYKSWLLHLINTIVYSPGLLCGSVEEKQYLTVEMFSDFEDDQNRPVTDLYVEIQTKKIELYSAVMHIHANFTGLRYWMYHWPLLSGLVGICLNLVIISFTLFVSWYNLFYTASTQPKMQQTKAKSPPAEDDFDPDLDNTINNDTDYEDGNDVKVMNDVDRKKE